MTQDPNSNYGNNPYENPPNAYGAQQNPNTPQNNPYETPQNPYGVPQDPAQQNPYGTPQTPYGAPQNPYQMPPQGQYGAPGYGTGPAFNPLPLGVAVQQLPNQYLKVLTKPSAATFAEELPKSSWDITWVQLLIYAVIEVVLGLIVALISSAIVRTTAINTPSSYTAALSMFTAATTTGSAFGRIITIPISFFVVVGIQYLLAKAFKGQGTFLGQGYTYLLFAAPIGILISLVSIIPFLGGIIAFALWVYSIVLNIFQVQASHRLSGGRATAVVLIPIAVGVLLFFLCVAAFAALIISLMHAGATH